MKQLHNGYDFEKFIEPEFLLAGCSVGGLKERCESIRPHWAPQLEFAEALSPIKK